MERGIDKGHLIGGESWYQSESGRTDMELVFYRPRSCRYQQNELMCGLCSLIGRHIPKTMSHILCLFILYDNYHILS